ncbi:hypothetical protein [Fervidibacter sp.]
MRHALVVAARVVADSHPNIARGLVVKAHRQSLWRQFRPSEKVGEAAAGSVATQRLRGKLLGLVRAY